MLAAMHPEDIKDWQSLQAWLNARPESSRQADALAIATRAAQRVSPLWSGAMDAAWSQAADVTALPVLRLLLTSGVARRYPTPKVRAAAIASATARAGFSAVARAGAGSHAAATAAHAAADVADAVAGSDSRDASTAVFSADIAAFSAASSTPKARADAAYLSDYALAADAARSAAALWTAIQADACDLVAGNDPQARALWPDTPPDWFTDPDTQARAIWARDPDTWSFWTRWWEGVLSGDQLDWGFQCEVALIPDALWQAGPAAVAEAVRQIGAGCALGLKRRQ